MLQSTPHNTYTMAVSETSSPGQKDTSHNNYTMAVSPNLQVRGYITQYLHHGCVSSSPGQRVHHTMLTPWLCLQLSRLEGTSHNTYTMAVSPTLHIRRYTTKYLYHGCVSSSPGYKVHHTILTPWLCLKLSRLEDTSHNTYTMAVSPTLQVRRYTTQYLHHGCVSNSPRQRVHHTILTPWLCLQLSRLQSTPHNTYTMAVSETLQVRGYTTQYLHHGCVSSSPGYRVHHTILTPWLCLQLSRLQSTPHNTYTMAVSPTLQVTKYNTQYLHHDCV